MSAYSFEIDTQEVSRTSYDCDFFIHPITNNSGMLCYLTLDSLAKGRHHSNISVEECDRRMKGVF